MSTSCGATRQGYHVQVCLARFRRELDRFGIDELYRTACSGECPMHHADTSVCSASPLVMLAVYSGLADIDWSLV